MLTEMTGMIFDDQERCIGSWFDEPLYMKSFKFTTPSEGMNQTLLDISNLQIKQIVKIDGVYRDKHHNWHIFPDNPPGATYNGILTVYGISSWVNSIMTIIHAHVGTNVSNQPIYLTLKYTKI